MQIYQVEQFLGWCCPGMLVFVNNDGYIVGQQLNPHNGATYKPTDELVPFNPKNYARVSLIDAY
jgi:hypothetical protein